MKKFSFILLALISGCVTCRQGAESWQIVAADRGTRSAVIVSGKPDDPAKVLWRWDPACDPGIRPGDARFFDAINECKVRDGGKTLLVCATYSGLAGVDIPTGRAKWYAKDTRGIGGPHSLDLLPDGRVAVANSVGCDALELIDVSAAPFDPSAQWRVRAAEVRGAHGVVWDMSRKTLFVLGYGSVYEFAYLPEVMAVEELRRWDYTAACGDEKGHDLSPDGQGGYFITNHTGVWRFDPEVGTFTAVRDKTNAKSFSRDAVKGDLLQIPTDRYWSNHLVVINPDGTERSVGPFAGAQFYKARWMNDGN